jgi:peptidoglycan/LPS O-acetylase OafA/YrhL
MVGRDFFSSKTEGFSVIGVLIAFAATVGVSAVSYRFFETPFLRYRKRFQRVISP